MKLYYCKTPGANFGDELNPWLWGRLIPELLDDDAETLFVGIGTLLNRSLPAAPRKVVFGSGFGYGKPPQLDERWRIYCVRGPITARTLGIDPDLAIADPGILVRDFAPAAKVKAYRYAFMPHHQSLGHADLARYCAAAGVHFIDPCLPVDEVLGEIQRTETLLTEAMHGAIVADALRVPWVPIHMYSQFFPLKWEDWCASLNVSYTPRVLPAVFDRPLRAGKTIENVFKRSVRVLGLGKEKWDKLPVRKTPERQVEKVVRALELMTSDVVPALSSDEAIDRAVARLYEKLDLLRRESRPIWC